MRPFNVCTTNVAPNNVRVAIVAPNYVQLKMYQTGYKTSISLNISGAIYDYLSQIYSDRQVFQFKGKFYLHWEESFMYGDSFEFAFERCRKALKQLKIIIREAKITLLQDEINSIKYCE